MNKKIIMVMNRLPITIERIDGGLDFKPSVGGLATGLSSLSGANEILWVGYCGLPWNKLNDNERGMIENRLRKEYNSIPVKITSHELRSYYNGFSNKTIWPLFHYFPYITEYGKNNWDSYLAVNEKFYVEVAGLFGEEEDAVVWVHDYHLMLLPALIREGRPAAKIGFFLHIPFPSLDIFRLLPWRREVLEGLLGSDLVGFHTYRYARHFLNSVLNILGIENRFGAITTAERTVVVDSFPMGIDYDRYSGALDRPEVVEEIAAIKKRLADKKAVLSVDRLDYTKGILRRLEAYDCFLTKYPEYSGNIVFIMLEVPSRTEIDSYKGLKSQVDEMIGRINGKYSTLNWTPIWYLYRSLPFENIVALYAVSDIAMVTPVRDGMNLVAKEYLACQRDKNGILIISEMAGVSEELGEAVTVNPNAVEEVADSIFAALKMGDDEKKTRLAVMQQRLSRNTIFKWTEDFFEKLYSVSEKKSKDAANLLTKQSEEILIRGFSSARNRLLLLDYDGTLVPFRNRPEEARPDKDLITLLGELSSLRACEVAVISGRVMDILEEWFSGLDITIIAEHGYWMKRRGGEWGTPFNLGNEWISGVLPVFQRYVDRTPGSFIEEKSHSLAFHYRKADPELSSVRTRDLKADLLDLIANLNLGILEGNKVLEVKSLAVNKGMAASMILSGSDYDYILAMGDDETDEDLFSVLPSEAHTIKIGGGATKAACRLQFWMEARLLLNKIRSS